MTLEQGRVEAMTVFGEVAEPVLSETGWIRCRSPARDIRHKGGHLRLLRRISQDHIRASTQAFASRFLATISGVLQKIISIFKVVSRCLEINLVFRYRS